MFLEWEQRQLAEQAGLSLPTIQRMEKLGMERSQAGNVDRVQRALEAAGIEFIPENGGGVGVRMQSPTARVRTHKRLTRLDDI